MAENSGPPEIFILGTCCEVLCRHGYICFSHVQVKREEGGKGLDNSMKDGLLQGLDRVDIFDFATPLVASKTVVN